MPEVTASLQVADAGADGGARPLDVDDLKTAATGASTEATLAAFKAANHTDLAALATALAEFLVLHSDLGSVLAKLSADPATQTTLAAFASASHTDQAAIVAKLSSDPATQTTLAALLAVAGTTADASSALTHTGLLKAIKASLAGTLLVDRGTAVAASTQTALSTSTGSADALVSNSSASFRQFVNTDLAIGITLKLGSGAVTDYAGIYLDPGASWDGLVSDKLYTGLVRCKAVSGTPVLAVVEG